MSKHIVTFIHKDTHRFKHLSKLYGDIYAELVCRGIHIRHFDLHESLDAPKGYRFSVRLHSVVINNDYYHPVPWGCVVFGDTLKDCNDQLGIKALENHKTFIDMYRERERMQESLYEKSNHGDYIYYQKDGKRARAFKVLYSPQGEYYRNGLVPGTDINKPNYWYAPVDDKRIVREGGLKTEFDGEDYKVVVYKPKFKGKKYYPYWRTRYSHINKIVVEDRTLVDDIREELPNAIHLKGLRKQSLKEVDG